MFTSDNDAETRTRKFTWKRATLAYAAIALFCFFFSAIYESFSHGVYSPYMLCLGLFPLLGGVLPLLILHKLKFPEPYAPVRGAYNAGIATLTVGSCLTGVFEIYGSVSPLTSVYWYVGGILMLIGAGLYFFLYSCVARVKRGVKAGA